MLVADTNVLIELFLPSAFCEVVLACRHADDDWRLPSLWLPRRLPGACGWVVQRAGHDLPQDSLGQRLCLSLRRREEGLQVHGDQADTNTLSTILNCFTKTPRIDEVIQLETLEDEFEKQQANQITHIQA